MSERVRAAGWDALVVVNDERIVLGLLRSVGRPAASPGPSTFRPDVLITKMATYMDEHKLESSPITTSDGKLVGLLLRADATRAAQEGNAAR